MQEYMLPFGPQHPALVEPAHIKLKLDGETIVGAELVLGYNHKGIEKSFESRWWAKGVFLSERVCGICGAYHTACYCQGIENMMKIEIPDRAKYIRVIVSELERIHSHMLALGVLAWEIGMDTLFHYLFRDRELVMESQEILTGNRVHFASNIIGGVRKDINAEQTVKVRQRMEKVRKRVLHYLDVFKNDASVKNRTSHIGYLSKKKAKELNPAGPNVRASGIRFDVRETGYFAYKDLKFKAITGEGGDIMERSVIRLKECLHSIDMIEKSLTDMPKGDLAVKVPLIARVDEGLETVSRVEAPRGELHYYIKSAGDRPYRVKIRTPTYQTFHVLEEILKGYKIADVGPILASLDPCFSCTDRMTVIDVNTKKEKIITRNRVGLGGS
ncbi:MAG: nickel-dependent hydrogenase large subunit, partial [Candidatus Peribacteraceae bacterium]|nr:nickel-dependent hydrogenase large subunit [Candidatus Peribacteraceae bacterium]